MHTEPNAALAQDAGCEVPSDWMDAGDSHPPLVPPVPKGFMRKVVLRSWVFDPARRHEKCLQGIKDRHVYYQLWNDTTDAPTGKKLSQHDSVEEYMSQHPQLGLSLDSFCFDSSPQMPHSSHR